MGRSHRDCEFRLERRIATLTFADGTVWNLNPDDGFRIGGDNTYTVGAGTGEVEIHPGGDDMLFAGRGADSLESGERADLLDGTYGGDGNDTGHRRSGK